MTKATIAAHIFVWDGSSSAHPLKPVRYCARCPLPESRLDVHTLPQVASEVTAMEQRKLGDR